MRIGSTTPKIPVHDAGQCVPVRRDVPVLMFVFVFVIGFVFVVCLRFIFGVCWLAAHLGSLVACGGMLHADYWADAWRQDILEQLRMIDTTNFVERYFKRVKYEFMRLVVNRRLSDLILMLLFKVDLFFIRRRRLFLAGRADSKEFSKSVKRSRAKAVIFEDKDAVIVLDATIGLLLVKSTRGLGKYVGIDPVRVRGFCVHSADTHSVVLDRYRMCVGELDCECRDCTDHEDYCKHLEGLDEHPDVAHRVQFSQGMRLVRTVSAAVSLSPSRHCHLVCMVVTVVLLSPVASLLLSRSRGCRHHVVVTVASLPLSHHCRGHVVVAATSLSPSRHCHRTHRVVVAVVPLSRSPLHCCCHRVVVPIAWLVTVVWLLPSLLIIDYCGSCSSIGAGVGTDAYVCNPV